MINVGLIGFGYWGPNLARNFSFNPDLELAAICDVSSNRLEAAKRHYPQVNLYKDLDDFFNDTALDAIAIATPAASHFKVAKKAISSGRHVLLEKPMTETVPQAEELIELAEQKNKTAVESHQTPATPSGMKPPYQKPPAKSRKKRPGAKQGHPGSRRKAPERIDRRVNHRAKCCPDCGGRLKRCQETRTR